MSGAARTRSAAASVGAQDQGFGDDLMALAFQFQRAAVGVAAGIAATALACLPAQPTLDRLARDQDLVRSQRIVLKIGLVDRFFVKSTPISRRQAGAARQRPRGEPRRQCHSSADRSHPARLTSRRQVTGSFCITAILSIRSACRGHLSASLRAPRCASAHPSPLAPQRPRRGA